MTSLYLFVFLGLFSPGPNVILLTTSGARFGFQRSLPHVFGVASGVGITAGLTGFGIGALLAALPALRVVLQLLAAGWILFMAYKLWIAQAASATAEDTSRDRPFTFVEAVLFQWVNPKVWAIAVAATAYTAGEGPLTSAWVLGTAFSGINLGVCLFWSFAGSLLSYLLTTPTAYRLFMRGMAILLAGSAVMVFL